MLQRQIGVVTVARLSWPNIVNSMWTLAADILKEPAARIVPEIGIRSRKISWQKP